MRRAISATLAALLLAMLTVSGVGATSNQTPPGWTHFHWVPTDMGLGMQCGVPFTSMHPTGYVDFWSGPISTNGKQRAVQHWNGTMVFTGPTGGTVTLRENDWRYIRRTFTAPDMSTYTERTASTGLLERLSTADGAKPIVDRGALITRTDNVDLGGGWYVISTMHVSSALGHVPMRRSGFNLDLQGWNMECDYFAAHLV